MLRNHIKIAVRNLKKHKGYSFINIAGLATGMACTILILLWVLDELSYDRFHAKAENIYRVLVEYPDNTGRIITAPVTPAPLAAAFKEEIPEIINAARWGKDERDPLKYEDKAFYEDGISTIDPEFLQMFTFSLVKGNLETAFSDKRSIVISEELAQKYFGDEDAIGKVLNWNNWQLYTVRGVIKNVPRNSHIQFDFLRTFQIEKESWPDGFTWYNFNRYTYVQLAEHADVQEVNRKMTEILKKNNQYTRIPTVKLSLQPLTEIHLNAGFESEYADIRDIKYIYIYSIIAFFILFIACINFMNLSTARSINRAKEVGMRKTAGAVRFQIFKQYIGESILLASVGQAIALLLVELFLPTFNNLSGKQLSVHYLDLRLIAGSIAIVLLTGLLAGSYPAIYLSSFSPLKVLKGTLNVGSKKSVLRKVLVVTQFSLSILLITSAVIVNQQLHFLRNKNLGFEKENVVYLPVKDNIGAKFEVAKNELLRDQKILSVAIKDCLPTTTVNSVRVAVGGQETERGFPMTLAAVGYDYFETLNWQLVAGRDFSKEFPTDANEAYILNEEAVQQLGIESPVGQTITVEDRSGTIIGVAKNAYFKSLHNKIEPQLYSVLNDYTSNAMNLLGVIMIKIKGTNVSETFANIEKIWYDVNPNYPLEINFLDEKYNSLYKSEKQISTIFNYFTFLAIFISCLGLFGLASFMAEQRTKEIGIRKVLGANIVSIVYMLSRNFTAWVLVANLIAWPVAYYLMNQWLQDFAYRINISWWTFILAGALALVIALLTVGYQAIKSATANPVEALRYE